MVFRQSEVRSCRFRKRLFVEHLESRQLLAGDVVAFFADGNLKVFGDVEDNAIRISTTDDVLTVAATDSDTVIKKGYSGAPATSAEFDLADLTASILVQMRHGNDSVVVGGEDTEDHVPPDGGNPKGGKPDGGHDGHDDDHEEEPPFTIPRDLIINAGQGNNGVRVSFTHVGRNLSVKAYGGDDTVDIGRGRGYGSEDHDDDDGCGDHTQTVLHALAAEDDGGGCEDEDGGPPADVVVGLRLRVETNGGDDGVKVSFTEVAGDLRLYTGQGDDLVAVGRGPMFLRNDPGQHDNGDHHAVPLALRSEVDCEDDCGDDGGHDTDHGEGGPPPDVRVGASVGIYTAGHDDKIKVAFAEIGNGLTASGGTGANHIVTGRGPIFGRHGSGGGGGGGHEPVVTPVALAAAEGGHAGKRPVDLRVGGRMVVDGSNGEDLVMLRNTKVASALRVTTRYGDDSVGTQNLKVEGSAAINVGQNNNIVALLDSSFADALDVTADYRSGGQDLVVFDSVSVNGRMKVSTGAEADRVVIQDSVFQDAVVVNMGAADDVLAARGNEFNGAAKFNGASGNFDKLFLAKGEDQNTFDSPPLTPSFEIELNSFDFDAVLDEIEDELAGFLQGRL